MDSNIIYFAPHLYLLLYQRMPVNPLSITLLNQRIIFSRKEEKSRISNVASLDSAEFFVKKYMIYINETAKLANFIKYFSKMEIFPLKNITYTYVKHPLKRSDTSYIVKVIDQKHLDKANTRSIIFEFSNGDISSISFWVQINNYEINPDLNSFNQLVS